MRISKLNASQEWKDKISNTLKGRKLSEETKLKCSLAKKGKKPNNFGKKLSKEQREKLSKLRMGRVSGMKGKRHSKETIDKMRAIHTGENNAFYGKKHTEETRKKIGELSREMWNNKKKQNEISK